MKLFDLLYSVLFCIRYLPFRTAIYVPILISYKVKVGKLKRGQIVILSKPKRYMITIGYKGYSLIDSLNSLLYISNEGKLILNGNCVFAQGCRIWIEKGAVMEIGNNFYCNRNCIFRAGDNIKIGNNVLMGWGIEMNTSDGHHLIIDNKKLNNHGDIVIGDNVWIASHCTFGKGSVVGNNSVIAQRSLVNKSFTLSNVLLGGIPAKVLKENVRWKL